MNNGEIVWLIILTLANAVFIALKIIEKKSNKKTGVSLDSNPGGVYPGTSKTCIKHGEAIASMKTDIANIKSDISAIFNKLNTRRK